MFSGCTGLTTVDLTGIQPLPSPIAYMSNTAQRMFSGCTGLTTMNLGTGGALSTFTDFKYMFSNCTALAAVNGVVDCSTVHNHDQLYGSPSGHGPFYQMLYRTKVQSITLKNVPESMVQWATAQEMNSWASIDGITLTVTIQNTVPDPA